MTAPPRFWEVDDRQRRRRVLHHLIPAALWAPTRGEKDACLEALMELQDCASLVARNPTSGAGAVGAEEPGETGGHPAGYADTFASNSHQGRCSHRLGDSLVNSVPCSIAPKASSVGISAWFASALVSCRLGLGLGL